eukprot:1179212-Prorocentrum_minimum.AAC.3
MGILTNLSWSTLKYRKSFQHNFDTIDLSSFVPVQNSYVKFCSLGAAVCSWFCGQAKRQIYVYRYIARDGSIESFCTCKHMPNENMEREEIVQQPYRRNRGLKYKTLGGFLEKS